MRLRHVVGTVAAFTLLAGQCFAQAPVVKDDVDTAYVQDYSDRIAGRVFSSTKFNTLVISTDRAISDLRYRPNNRINLGVGISYRKLTLNIGFPAPFINRDDDRFGHTRYLDAQANILGASRATNLFLQVFEGYHISSYARQMLGWGEQGTEEPYRADLVEFNAGISTMRVYNNRRFSYRAAFNQDAWQRRSQGSWMLGGYAAYYHLHADSSLVPERLADRFTPAAGIRIADMGDLGPIGGYAYTWVKGRHWFFTASLAAGAGISVQRTVTVRDGIDRDVTSVGPGYHIQVRGGTGYNSSRDQLGLTYNQEWIGYVLPRQSVLAWSVGNVRLTYVHRFAEHLPWLDHVVGWLKRKSPKPDAAPPTDR